MAAKAMQELGVENVCDLEGGFHAWKEAGGAVAEKPVKLPK